MSKRSSQELTELLIREPVVVLTRMQEALGGASRATVFRQLRQVNYRRSYNFNGRYYTRHDPARYDKHGLFSHQGIHFSRDGDLGTTVSRLVCESAAGQTQRELQETLRVRVQPVLLDFVHRRKIARERFEGLYLYLHPAAEIRKAQLDKRKEMMAALAVEGEVTDGVVIEVLLVLIHYPGSREGDVARRLKGRSPPITVQHVRVVFERYNLDDVGEKGGPCGR